MIFFLIHAWVFLFGLKIREGRDVLVGRCVTSRPAWEWEKRGRVPALSPTQWVLMFLEHYTLLLAVNVSYSYSWELMLLEPQLC